MYLVCVPNSHQDKPIQSGGSDQLTIYGHSSRSNVCGYDWGRLRMFALQICREILFQGNILNRSSILDKLGSTK